MGSIFDRALSAAFIDTLAAEARHAGWWADVLADNKLLVGLRGKFLNVYWRGQSLFNAKRSSDGLRATTHAKYLIDPKLASQVHLAEGAFDIAPITGSGIVRRYEGPATLAKMKSAAGVFSGSEKTGCHEIAVRNPAVVDCEIAFPGRVSLGDGGDDKLAPRIDLASIESRGDEARLVFWEAKHYQNGELRAENGSPPVVRQIEVYKKYLRENRDAIERSYANVTKNLLSISQMGWKRQLSPAIIDVATQRRRLTLGPNPTVRLIIFGFDSAQRDHAVWKRHHERLERDIETVNAAGDAKNIRLPT